MTSRSAAAVAATLMLVMGQGAAAEAQQVADGERLFRQRCASCHALQPGQSRAGPHLAAIVGRPAGSVEGARYSQALQGSRIVWDEQSLGNFLANPRKMIPGTTMTVAVPNEGQRRSIIAYLQSLPSAAQ